MVKSIHLAGLLLALCVPALPASAQAVYRCAQSYSNQPCPDAKLVPVDDPRSAAQRAQTDAATRRDARSAQVLEQERLRQEGQPAQTIAPPPKAEAVASVEDRTVSRSKLARPELFTAVAPRKPGEPAAKKKKKATKKATA